jgi:hypothetical protein
MKQPMGSAADTDSRIDQTRRICQNLLRAAYIEIRPYVSFTSCTCPAHRCTAGQHLRPLHASITSTRSTEARKYLSLPDTVPRRANEAHCHWKRLASRSGSSYLPRLKHPTDDDEVKCSARWKPPPLIKLLELILSVREQGSRHNVWRVH